MTIHKITAAIQGNTCFTFSVCAIILNVALWLTPIKANAQPYLDIINIKYSISPDAGIFNRNKNGNKLQFLGAGTNIPVQFKNKKDAVIFSPFFESWTSNVGHKKTRNVYSIGIPVTLSKSLPGNRWNIQVTGIIRLNDSSLKKDPGLQVGGALIAAYAKSEDITWKFGCYVNNEFFGIFMVPLLGINWNIGQKDKLFGILPGNLTYEHRINKKFYYGANFRAITNSFNLSNKYWRIDENQLGIYLDSYLGKNMVLNIEAGHSLFRKIRTGIKDIKKNDLKVNDNLYFRTSFAYRVRFSKGNNK